jgi:hypothetical protein
MSLARWLLFWAILPRFALWCYAQEEQTQILVRFKRTMQNNWDIHSNFWSCRIQTTTALLLWEILNWQRGSWFVINKSGPRYYQAPIQQPVIWLYPCSCFFGPNSKPPGSLALQPFMPFSTRLLCCRYTPLVDPTCLTGRTEAFAWMSSPMGTGVTWCQRKPFVRGA